MRTEDAVTQAERRLGDVHARAAALRRAGRGARDRRCARWRGAGATSDDEDSDVPYGPSRPRRAARGSRVSTADAVAGVLVVGVTAYAVFGGADFGAGFWSLVAGGGERGRRARELIDWAIGPVWEANHVWLIFVLVVLWTGVLDGVRVDLLDALHPAQPGGARASCCAARASRSTRRRGGSKGRRARRAAVRALVAAHAVLHGHRRRRGRRRAGCRSATPPAIPSRSWLNPLSLLIGALFVATSRVPRGGVPRQRRPPRRRPRPRALLQHARALGGRRRRGRARRRRHRRAARRRALRLRRAHRRRAAARDRLRALRRRRARPAAPRRAPRAPGRSRSAPSSPWSGAGASRSTRTCCRRSLTIDAGAAPSATLTALLIVFGVAVVLVLPSIAPALHARAAEPDRGGRAPAAASERG